MRFCGDPSRPHAGTNAPVRRKTTRTPSARQASAPQPRHAAHERQHREQETEDLDRQTEAADVATDRQARRPADRDTAQDRVDAAHPRPRRRRSTQALARRKSALRALPARGPSARGRRGRPRHPVARRWRGRRFESSNFMQCTSQDEDGCGSARRASSRRSLKAPQTLGTRDAPQPLLHARSARHVPPCAVGEPFSSGPATRSARGGALNAPEGELRTPRQCLAQRNFPLQEFGPMPLARANKHARIERRPWTNRP